MDVGLQSTQARRNTGKQGAQTRSLGTSSQAFLHQWLHCISNKKLTKQVFQFVLIYVLVWYFDSKVCSITAQTMLSHSFTNKQYII